MANDSLLMIFVKNPVLGKVKTRLAKVLGPEDALQIYKKLLVVTQKATGKLPVDKAVFYSDEIENNDGWDDQSFQKYAQQGSDLGKRMFNAFKLAFGKGYKNVVIIGSDSPGITSKIITKAFDALKTNQVVIGPSHDGGYYLLGKKQMMAVLFKNKRWSRKMCCRIRSKTFGSKTCPTTCSKSWWMWILQRTWNWWTFGRTY